MTTNMTSNTTTRPPNILFFLPDQHRPDWLGVHTRLPLRTVNLDRLGATGVRFEQAFTPSPLCAPARACLASGLDYERCRVPNNKADYPLDLPTYYQRLRDAGYRVGGVGKFDLHKGLANSAADLDWGIDGSRLLEEWGFTEGIDNEGKLDGSSSYRAAGRAKGPYLRFLQDLGLAETYVREHAERRQYRDAYITALPDEAYCDNWVAQNGLDFLKAFPAGRPWHLVVNFTGPHSPMDVTQRMHDEWQEVVFPPPYGNDRPEYSAADHQRNRRHYAAMIQNIDRHVGRFIEAVRDRGELENTLIIYASDHGEMLGDHNLWGKSTWYTPSSGIPLLVSGPDVAGGRTSRALVSLHDLTATLLDYAGAESLPAMDSLSLRGILEGKKNEHRPYVCSGLDSWRMVFEGRYKLVTRLDEPPLLYDVETDPQEMRNIATDAPAEVNRLSALLRG